MHSIKTTLLILALCTPGISLAKSNAIDHHYAAGERTYNAYEGSPDRFFKAKLEAAQRARNAGQNNTPSTPPPVVRIATNADDQRLPPAPPPVPTRTPVPTPPPPPPVTDDQRPAPSVPQVPRQSPPQPDNGSNGDTSPTEQPSGGTTDRTDPVSPPPLPPIPSAPAPQVATVPEIDGNSAALALALLLALVAGYRERARA